MNWLLPAWHCENLCNAWTRHLKVERHVYGFTILHFYCKCSELACKVNFLLPTVLCEDLCVNLDEKDWITLLARSWQGLKLVPVNKYNINPNGTKWGQSWPCWLWPQKAGKLIKYIFSNICSCKNLFQIFLYFLHGFLKLERWEKKCKETISGTIRNTNWLITLSTPVTPDCSFNACFSVK